MASTSGWSASATEAWAAVALGVMALAGAACDRSPLSGLDAGRDARFEADLSFVGDLAARPDSAGCTRHTMKRAVTLVALAALDVEPHEGATVRLLATYPIRDCEGPADIQVNVQPGNATDFVTVTARVWLPEVETAACQRARSVRRVIALPPRGVGANPRVVVRDGAGGPAQVALGVAATPASDCATPATLGGACQLDCQCPGPAYTARCLDTNGRGGFVCASSCSTDAECVLAGLDYCDTVGSAVRPPYTCAPAAAGCGCDASRCLPGHDCSASGSPACVCRPLPGGFYGPCACDEDCPAGDLCGANGCFHPCTTVADCPPEGLYCDGTCMWGI